MIRGAVLAWQGRPEEAEPWVQRAERTRRAEADPAAALEVLHLRGVQELARGHDASAIQRRSRLPSGSPGSWLCRTCSPRSRGLRSHTLVRLGDTKRAEDGFAGLASRNANAGRYASPWRRCGWPRTTGRGRRRSRLRSATGSASLFRWSWLAGAFLLEAITSRRARRPHRCRARPGTRSRPRRARQHALAVHAAASPDPARAPCPAPHESRLADRRDQQPAGRKELRPADRRNPGTAGNR